MIDYSAFPKICRALGRWPDKVVGENIDPYLLRWFIIKNRFFNIYLHKFMRSDIDRALHDHPWSWNVSIILRGSYIEHMPFDLKTFGKNGDMRTIKKLRRSWRPIFRIGTTPHRVELHKITHRIPHRQLCFVYEQPVWTLFITGPDIREWGFYCPKGWRWQKDFLSEREGGSHIGKGCED